MDGDGYADLIGFANNGVYVAYSDGQTFGAPVFVLGSFATNAGGWSSFNMYPRCLGNYKKCNGPASIIGFGAAGVYKSEFISRNSFSTPSLVLNSAVNAGGFLVLFFIMISDFFQGWQSFDKYPRVCADWNDDGIYDIVGFGNDNVYYSSYDNVGGNFASPTVISTQFSYSDSWTSYDKYPR